jgi:hypothetical protein
MSDAENKKFLAKFLAENPDHSWLMQHFTTLNLPEVLADAVARHNPNATNHFLCRFAAQLHENMRIPGLGLQRLAVLRAFLADYVREHVLLPEVAVEENLQAAEGVLPLDPWTLGVIDVAVVIYNFIQRQEEAPPNSIRAHMEARLVKKPKLFPDMLRDSLLELTTKKERKEQLEREIHFLLQWLRDSSKKAGAA